MTEIQALIAMRKAGKVPANVALWLDDYPERARRSRWFELSLDGELLPPEIHITGDLSMLDLRCLVALDVQIFTKLYTPRAAQLFGVVKAARANSAALWIGPDGAFDVILWTPKWGDGDISDLLAVQRWCDAQRHVRASA